MSTNKKNNKHNTTLGKQTNTNENETKRRQAEQAAPTQLMEEERPETTMNR